jgi:hypothetical protein
VTLFRPGRDQWREHFGFQSARIKGLTAIGRATVQVLSLNDARRLQLRLRVACLWRPGLKVSVGFFFVLASRFLPPFVRVMRCLIQFAACNFGGFFGLYGDRVRRLT